MSNSPLRCKQDSSLEFDYLRQWISSPSANVSIHVRGYSLVLQAWSEKFLAFPTKLVERVGPVQHTYYF